MTVHLELFGLVEWSASGLAAGPLMMLAALVLGLYVWLLVNVTLVALELIGRGAGAVRRRLFPPGG